MRVEQRALHAASDAVADVERALSRAAEALEDLSAVAASSLRVLDEAATDAFKAHQDDRREVYLESAGEHLARLRIRSGVMNDLGDQLTRYVAAAGSAATRAGNELDLSPETGVHDVEVRDLRGQIEVLSEVVALARPVADQITRHSVHVVESSTATDALMLLDSRVHDASREVSRADEGVSMMRAVIESAQSKTRTSASASADSLTYAATHRPPDAPGNLTGDDWVKARQVWTAGSLPPPPQPGQSRDPGIAI